VHPEIEELRPKLKEILYDCAVEIRATKAALYLSDGQGHFQLVSEYGFRGAVRQTADANDPMIDRCGRGRTPFFINGLGVEPRFAELLYESGTDRLLTAPIWSRGTLVGMIDMRDKAQKQPFEHIDLSKAQGIAERIASLFSNMNVFGQRFISVSNLVPGEEVNPERSSGRNTPASSRTAPSPHAPSAPAAPEGFAAPALFVVPASWPVMPDANPGQPAGASAPASVALTSAAEPAPVPKPLAAVPAPSPVPMLVPVESVAPTAAPAPATPARRPTPPPTRIPRLATLVHEARQEATSIVMPIVAAAISESELSVAREVLRLVLLIPGATVAMFSAFTAGEGRQETMSRGPMTDEASTFLQSKLHLWLSKRGESGAVTRSNVSSLPGVAGPPIGADRVQKVFTAPIVIGSMRGLYLTVAFSGTPDRAAHELLAALHGQMQVALEHSTQREALAAVRQHAAETLLTPAFSSFPELRKHTMAVVGASEEFGRFLALGPAEMDTLRLVAMTHDAGMRLLDYDRLYSKKNISPDELSILREHVSVGAAMVAPLLGNEVARAVLSHHERFDGRGYPSELQGEEIPLEARIVQICDAWVAMTDPQSYQTPVSKDQALMSISRGAGSQFDPELVRRFLDSMR
jgi:hypothetical protein